MVAVYFLFAEAWPKKTAYSRDTCIGYKEFVVTYKNGDFNARSQFF